MRTLPAIDRLARFDGDGLLVASVYMNTDGRQIPTEADYRSSARSLLAQANELVRGIPALSRTQQQSLGDDLTRIKEYIDHGFSRDSVKGLAVFSCTGKGLWETLQLRLNLSTRVVVDNHPFIQPLVRMTDEFGRYCIVLVSKEAARLFSLHIGSMEEVATIHDAIPPKVASPSRYEASERRIERHHLARVHDHLKRVNSELLGLFRDARFDHLILGGRGEILSEFERTLHSYLARKVAGRIDVDVDAAESEIVQKVAVVEQDIERNKARLAMERLIGEKQGGKAVIGIEETLRALSDGRVQALFVVDGLSVPGARCPDCRSLSMQAGRCICGADMSSAKDVVAEAIDQAIRQSTEVRFVGSEGVVEGMGAILRY